MRDVTGKGCNEPGAPTRTDLGYHDFTGGNTFVPDIIPIFFPDEVDVAQLQDAKARAVHMIQLAATLEITPEEFGTVLGYGLSGRSTGVMMFTIGSVAKDDGKMEAMKRAYLKLSR